MGLLRPATMTQPSSYPPLFLQQSLGLNTRGCTSLRGPFKADGAPSPQAQMPTGSKPSNSLSSRRLGQNQSIPIDLFIAISEHRQSTA